MNEASTSDQPLRRANVGDAGALAALKLLTFRETFLAGGFAIPYPPDDLATFEASSYAPTQISAELAEPDRATWLAQADGQLVGYAQVGPCKLPHAEVAASDGELFQLYVRRACQGRGIGAELLDAALAHLARHRPGPVWLGVWSGNDRAQAVYTRRGFRKVGEYGFPVGRWTDHEYIFRRD